MKFSKLVFISFLSTVFLTSCDPDDEPQQYVPLGDYDSGVLVLNQGGFGADEASVSFVSFDLNTLENNIFATVNPSLTLGNTGQDMGFYNDLAYIVVNASNKIEIVNRYTMSHVATISSGLNNPRYIAFANGKGYVTNWGDGTNITDDYVAVINLTTNSVSSQISVIEGPERIIENNGKLYVAQTGGFGYGNAITVINGTTNTVETTITVGDVPNSMVINNGILLVSCGGIPYPVASQTAGKIVKVNLATNTVINTYSYADVNKHTSNLAVFGSDMYYTIDSGIYKMALSATTLPIEPAFSTTTQGVYGVYSFAIKNNHIYVGDAGDYDSDGKIHIYSLGTNGSPALGTLQKSHTVGIIPAGFYFNQ